MKKKLVLPEAIPMEVPPLGDWEEVAERKTKYWIRRWSPTQVACQTDRGIQVYHPDGRLVTGVGSLSGDPRLACDVILARAGYLGWADSIPEDVRKLTLTEVLKWLQKQ